jgi:hypothetical protein
LADAEKLKNTDAVICGRLQKFTPWESGKGAGHMFWQFEIMLADGTAIPVVNMDKSDGESTPFDEYVNSNVLIHSRIFYGIIIGDSNPEHQSMTGYRIDAESIVMELETTTQNTADTLTIKKINIDLTKFNDEGYRVHPDGEKSAANYEFCIPANDSVLAIVKAIDPTAGEMRGSKGRSGCSDKEWLVIGSTRQSNFKDVLKKLAGLDFIRKITETFWE